MSVGAFAMCDDEYPRWPVEPRSAPCSGPGGGMRKRWRSEHRAGAQKPADHGRGVPWRVSGGLDKTPNPNLEAIMKPEFKFGCLAGIGIGFAIGWILAQVVLR